ncbi:hypothetical protein HDU96_005755 [Phlyctochytrium bullatum]|nr:hypothetical protein HDU96_005755 [Phlyctochytrium bullatum]
MAWDTGSLQQLGEAMADLPGLNNLELVVDDRSSKSGMRLIERLADAFPRNMLSTLHIRDRVRRFEDVQAMLRLLEAQADSLRSLKLHIRGYPFLKDDDTETKLLLNEISRCFRQLKRLKKADVFFEIGNTSFFPVLDASDGLSRLKVHSIVPHPDPWADFAPLFTSAWQQLSSLEVIFCTSPVQCIVDVFNVLGQNLPLRSFKLHCHGYTDEQEATSLPTTLRTILAQASPIPTLETFDLRISHVGGPTLHSLARFLSGSPRLHSLHLGTSLAGPPGSQMSETDAKEFLRVLLSPPQLRTVSFAFDISDRYTDALVDVLQSQRGGVGANLRHLSLLCSTVDSGGFLRCMPGIVEALPRLQTLEIDLGCSLVFDLHNLESFLGRVLTGTTSKLQELCIRDCVYTVLRKAYPTLLQLLPSAPPSLRRLELRSAEQVGEEEVRFLEQVEEVVVERDGSGGGGDDLQVQFENGLRRQRLAGMEFGRLWKVRRGLPRELMSHFLDVQTRTNWCV